MSGPTSIPLPRPRPGSTCAPRRPLCLGLAECQGAEADGARLLWLLSAQQDLGSTAYAGAPTLQSGSITAPLAGYGVGLPLSRLYARYFGGDLQLLSPASPLTWAVLAALANETASVFSDRVMHWGGDEVINGWAGVAHGCWSRDAKIRTWMAAHGVNDDTGIYLHFAAFLDKLARNRTSGGTAMHWHDLWLAANASGAKNLSRHIVQNWGGAEVTVGATADGHPVVVSGGYYLE